MITVLHNTEFVPINTSSWAGGMDFLFSKCLCLSPVGEEPGQNDLGALNLVLRGSVISASTVPDLD